MVTLPKSLRSSWMLLMRRAQGRDAQAAGNQQDIVALHLLEREAAAERPADAHDVAALHLVQRLGEATGAAHAQLDEATLGGELDEMEMGASPTPKMVSSTNWPGSWRNASRMRSSIKRNSNSFSVAVNSVMDVMRAGHGRYGLAAMSSWPVDGCRLIVVRRYDHGVEIGVS